MILPPRPLRLRPAYVARAYRRMAAVAFGVVIAAWIFWAAPANAWISLWMDHAAEVPVEVVEASIADSRGIGPIEVFYVYLAVRQGGVERTENAGPYFMLSGPPASAETIEAWREPSTGRLSTSVERAYVGDRFAAAVLLLAVFGGALGVLVWLLVARWRDHRSVVRAAASGEEMHLEVVRQKNGHYDYRTNETLAGDEGGYRTTARRSGWLARFRPRSDEEGPLVMNGPSGPRLLALRVPKTQRVVVVRQDLWPFAIDGTARAETMRRLTDPT